jgi:hypothetical protein
MLNETLSGRSARARKFRNILTVQFTLNFMLLKPHVINYTFHILKMNDSLVKKLCLIIFPRYFHVTMATTIILNMKHFM